MGLDKKVFAVLALLAAGVYLIAPGVFSLASLPLLLILVVCPLSMVLMMKMMMQGSSNGDAAGGRRGEDHEVTALREEIELLRARQGERRSGEVL